MNGEWTWSTKVEFKIQSIWWQVRERSRKDVNINTTKRCNKIRFQPISSLNSERCIFLCLIDTWYNDSQFEAKIKSSRDSLRLKFNAHKKHQVAERERNECCSNFRQHFFSSSRLKADARGKQRDRTVKNPSEAFNLLLQQNFISTLIFFMREKRRQKCDRFEQSKQIFHVFVPSIPAFLFRHNENSFAYARQRNRSSETVPAEYCINTFYTNIMPDKYFLARCVTVVATIALLLSFIDIVPRAGNAFSSKNFPSTQECEQKTMKFSSKQ